MFAFRADLATFPESLKSDTGAYRQWNPVEGCTKCPCSSNRRSTYVCYLYVVHLPFAYYFSAGRTYMQARKKEKKKRKKSLTFILILNFLLFFKIILFLYTRMCLLLEICFLIHIYDLI
ncbi:hypothetical protein PUN28_018053 [Cardiocondyla obscurior]|uniref:Uncharacterized protein n=1 Tax=Cardiocondyla obscurior TaxID=286306 RepID=A0AAW2EJR7_9HYME